MGGSPTYARQAARVDLEDAGPDIAGAVGDVVGLNAPALTGKLLKQALKSFSKANSVGQSAIRSPKANAALGRSSYDPAEVERLLG